MSSASQRQAMVERQLKRRNIRDPRVLEAMGRIPREEFVEEMWRSRAYDDAPLPIPYGQTISQPYITALMAETLALTGAEKVLDVGTGSGYHAAVLGALAREVVTIERIPRLAVWARRNLRRTGLAGNIRIVCGDGSLGCSRFAPYDAISVAAGAPEPPAELFAQLNDPGTMVIPIGDRDEQALMVYRKAGGNIARRMASACRFVPLIGKQAWR